MTADGVVACLESPTESTSMPTNGVVAGVLWCWRIAQLAQVAIDPELHNIWCFPSAVAAGRHGQVEVAVERSCGLLLWRWWGGHVGSLMLR